MGFKDGEKTKKKRTDKDVAEPLTQRIITRGGQRDRSATQWDKDRHHKGGKLSRTHQNKRSRHQDMGHGKATNAG